jgi:hypothetical protein
MKTPSPEISDAMRAVSAYKHDLMVNVQREILRVALRQPFFSSNDIAEDIIAPEHRQGVVSNAWNSLASLEIIERLPMTYFDEPAQILAGRIKSTHKGRKSAWNCAYRLRSRSLAETWLDRNTIPSTAPCSPFPDPTHFEQKEMFAA